MRKEAYHGLAGDVVRIAEPETEASPEALLTQFLISAGNILGYNIFMNQGGWHHLNEYMCLVGDTSQGRKGTSYAVLRDLLALLDEKSESTRVKSGIQTGEALIHSIRDAREQVVKGVTTYYHTIILL